MPPERLSSLVHRIVSPLHSRSNSTHSQEKLAHSSQDKINNHEKPASPSPASPASPLASPVDRESPLRNSQQFGPPSRSSSSTGGGTPASGTVSPPNGVKKVEHIRSARASTDSGFASGGNGMRYDKTKRRLYEEEKIEQRRRSEEEQLRAGLDEETRARYGDLEKPQELTTIQDISSLPAGAHVAFRARIFTQRRVSKSLDFLLFREQTFSIQGVLANAPPQMIKWTQRLHPESIVQVTGTLKEPKTPVTSATCQDREVDIFSIHLVNSARNLAFNNYMPPEALHQRMQARVVDLRHPSNQALFRIRAAVARTFRAELDAKGFMEIQTPKLQPAATESGAEVFKVNYFGRRAFLAQSPQLAKQMAISADFGRVYEVGPVFRAENSNTHRHLTEYTGLDLEMSLQKSYTELIQVVDSTIKAILETITSMPEVQIVRQRWPSTDLVWLDETPVIPFREGVQMLRDDGRDVEEEDLSTRDEIRLGELVKAKYKTDYYILDKFPANARPFYTHKAADPKWTNSFDVFLRGQEIGTGGQRIHVLETLRKSMMEAGIAEDGMEDYISAFQAGAPPHGGVGLGLERILTFGLELGDIRFASPFHRDTKSLPERPPSLPHPDADTLKPRDPDAELPPVEKLIANYGDATNTSWLDERFEIWRHQPTGAAIGFARQDSKFVMITGDPLCDQRQYAPIIDEFLHYVHDELRLKPVWMIVSEEVQEVLARKHGWRTLTCIEEQRLNTENENIPPPHRDRAARRVEREGISIHEVRPDEQFVPRADRAIASWKAHRKGKQVHLTEVRPWVDPEHRRYFAAERDKEVLGLVVLARLAPRHGWQVKWALNFPAAPNGTIEQLIEHALSAVPGPITFGAGVSENLTPKAHIDGVRARALARTYKTIVHSLRINRKAQFREKFGVVGEAMYICYPRHGLGLADLRQIVKFFED